ncbi:hypothetical protein EDB19DRAFT_1698398 [Suillus lakei]|nr:hypothetical protein EDB19DRAFT_1698398 [Suillus lakei]
MASDQSMEMDVQYVMTRKRKRPAYDSQGDGARDLLHSETSIDMREPSLGLIPPIVTLPPARDTTATKEAVTVDKFIRRIIAGVPGPRRKRKLRTVQLQDTSISESSMGGANIQPATRPTLAKVYACNGGRISKNPVENRKPMTLTQRLARAAILSHVETKEILHPPGISCSRRPLNFVPFQKFATPPSSPRKKLIKRSAFSRSESFAVTLRSNRRQRLKRQPACERPGYPPLTFIPSHEAKAAYASRAQSHSESSVVILRDDRRQKPKRQRTFERPGYPPLTFIPSHEAKTAYASRAQSHSESSAVMLRDDRRQKSKRQPTSERPGYPQLTFIPSHEAKAAYASRAQSHSESSAVMLRQKPKRQHTSERPGYPQLTFIPSHEAEAAYSRAQSHPESSAVMLPGDRPQRLKRRPTSERPGYPPLTFIPSREA